MLTNAPSGRPGGLRLHFALKNAVSESERCATALLATADLEDVPLIVKGSFNYRPARQSKRSQSKRSAEVTKGNSNDIPPGRKGEERTERRRGPRHSEGATSPVQCINIA